MNRVSKDNYYLNIARAVSMRSTCNKRKYGCVIVNNDEIIATGYNGSPRGEANCCDNAKYGYCKRKDKEHNTGDYSDCNSVHAEQNAMLSARRKDMIGATLYLYGWEFKYNEETHYMQETPIKAEPCPICSRMIKNAGISKIINKDSGDKYVFN